MQSSDAVMKSFSNTRWLATRISGALLLAGIFAAILVVSHVSSAAATGVLSYYFPVYDDTSGYQSTILVGNVGTASTDIEIDIAGTVQYTDTLAADQSIEWSAAGLKSGPVEVKSLSGEPLVVSQRVFSGNGVTETYAVQTPDSDYYFPAYDSSASSTTYIELANPAVTDASVSVYIAGSLKGNYPLAAGTNAELFYPDTTGGPVEVVSDGGAPFVVSERTIVAGVLDERMGVGTNTGAASDTVWTWMSGAAALWIENPTGASIYFEFSVNGTLQASWTMNPGVTETLFPLSASGDVEFRTWTDSSKTTPAKCLAAQLRGGNKFIEGADAGALGASYFLSRLDDDNPGLISQLYLANLDSIPATIDVYVGQNDIAPAYTYALGPHAAMQAGPPAATAGPVRVRSRQGTVVLASQDYTRNVAKDYYFPWYDNVYGYTWLLMAQPQGSGANTLDAFLKSSSLETGISVAGSSTVTRRFDGRLGGPIKVSSLQSQRPLISERSLFGNSFEEVWSTAYDQLDSHYYWPTYMGFDGAQEWVLVSNPLENNETIDAYLHITTLPQNQGDPKPADINVKETIAPGDSWTPIYLNTMGEAVEVKTCVAGGNPDNPADARKSITSERLLAGGAFNEMAGIPASHLQEANMWTWFDNVSSDGDMIFVGNPNAVATVYAGIWIGGTYRGQIAIPHGMANVWPQSNPGQIMDGPVEVLGCYDDVKGAYCSNPAPIYSSQSSQFGPAYEETAAILPSELKPTANWTWYDEQSSGSLNWVLVANPNQSDIYYEISIAGLVRSSGMLGAGARVTPRFPGIMGGPVTVSAWTGSGKSTPANVLASQRVLWNGFFNEVVGQGQ